MNPVQHAILFLALSALPLAAAETRFDFNGHGESGGEFSRMTVSNEVLDAEAVLARCAEAHPGADHAFAGRNGEAAGAIAGFFAAALASQPSTATPQETPAMNESVLDAKDTALAKIGAAVARGDQDALAAAFGEGFEVGLTLDEAKEVVGQLYAYCGFPRALNAAATLMQVAGDSLTQSPQSAQRRLESQDNLFASASLREIKTSRTSRTSREENSASGLLGEKALEIGTANQTKLCGREVNGPLFDFHPQLDAYLKAHLFGDIFARNILDWRTRELVTVAALAARPETAPQCASHVGVAQLNGVSPAQTDAILAAALPKDWSAFPVGDPNVAYAKYFKGASYLARLSTNQVGIAAVTFEPGCRNNWHIHHAAKGGGQILVCTAGRGYYQEWGRPAVEMKPGDTVNIPAGVKHWHGAAPDSWFQHLSIEPPGEGTSNEWLEPVDDAAFAAATN